MPPTNPQTDELTGLFTRKAFLELFDQLMAEAVAKNFPLSLAFLDVDVFLEVNNQYGHIGGDNVLVAIAELIKTVVTGEVVAARYGGDEFVVIFPKIEREQAFLALEHVRAEVEKMQIPGSEAMPPITGITISGGVASFPIDGRTGVELLRKADQAMYRAKAMGRNTIRLAYEERMVPKTTHYTLTQLERLSKLASEKVVGEAELLREAMDDLLIKYGLTDIER